ncbi:alanine--tRNA ligase [Candidatus Berkelbacteria bacterium]|nr:alanine--tRNA ligase [Candidatus Berkelbacteria bacterium]
MTHQELRRHFLAFFHERGHTQCAPAPLIPAGDASVLFTVAGMQQFKPFYLEPERAPANPIVTIQPCIRTVDIEEVGDERHLTVFEMVGNFAFGNKYFKREAIQLAYDLFFKEFGISLDRAYVTVFRGDKEAPLDQEAIALWRELGISDDKIRMGDREDNWWGPTGETGPCGPTTEIYIDGIEVWNIVFNEYVKQADGSYLNSDQPGIDTGAGLERLLMVLNNQATVFETELLAPLGDDILPAVSSKETRVIIDHLRAAVFLLAEGLLPSNKDRGYILRRLIRRAMRYARRIDFREWSELIDRAITIYGVTDLYPHLTQNARVIHDHFDQEHTRFAKLLDQGIKHLAREMEQFDRVKKLTVADATTIAEIAFHMYQSFGFPPEMVLEEFEQSGFPIRAFESAFQEHFTKHQEVSRAGQERKFGGHGLLLDTGELRAANEEELKKVTRLHTATHLLQAALRQVLGTHVLQKGSDITAERLRFDFNHDTKLTDQEITQVETLVNRVVGEDHPMGYVELPLEEAKQTGALFLPHVHYRDIVKVYFDTASLATAFTKEFCGGPHVTHTAAVGQFKIVKDEALAAGIRRIRADVI